MVFTFEQFMCSEEIPSKTNICSLFNWLYHIKSKKPLSFRHYAFFKWDKILKEKEKLAPWEGFLRIQIWYNRHHVISCQLLWQNFECYLVWTFLSLDQYPGEICPRNICPCNMCLMSNTLQSTLGQNRGSYGHANVPFRQFLS